MPDYKTENDRDAASPQSEPAATSTGPETGGLESTNAQKDVNQGQGDVEAIQEVLGGLDKEELEWLALGMQAHAVGGPAPFLAGVALGLDQLGVQPASLNPELAEVSPEQAAQGQDPGGEKVKKALSKERADTILAEAQKQWELGFSHEDRHKYSVKINFYASEEGGRSEEGSGKRSQAVEGDNSSGSFNWCGAYVGQCYRATGMSSSLLPGFAGCTKLHNTMGYEDAFSRGFYFYESPEQAREDPKAGKRLPELEAHKTQQRQITEFLYEGESSTSKYKDRTELVQVTGEPESQLATLKEASSDIRPADILIVGENKETKPLGSHIALIQDVNFEDATSVDDVSFSTFEGNTGAGAEHKRMSEASREQLDTLRKQHHLERAQIDSALIERQIDDIAFMLEVVKEDLEEFKGTSRRERKGLKLKLSHERAAIARGRGCEKSVVNAVASKSISEARDELLDLQRTFTPELLEDVRAWEQEARSPEELKENGERSAPAPNGTVVGKRERGFEAKSKPRFIYRLSPRDFEPYYFLSNDAYKKAVKA